MPKMNPSDPAYWMLGDKFKTAPDPKIYDKNCYICTDDEYARMGLPLCYACPSCGGHVAADEGECSKKDCR